MPVDQIHALLMERVGGNAPAVSERAHRLARDIFDRDPRGSRDLNEWLAGATTELRAFAEAAAPSLRQWVVGSSEDIQPMAHRSGIVLGLLNRVEISLPGNRWLLVTDDEQHVLTFWWKMWRAGRWPANPVFVHVDDHNDTTPWRDADVAIPETASVSDVAALTDKTRESGFLVPAFRTGLLAFGRSYFVGPGSGWRPGPYAPKDAANGQLFPARIVDADATEPVRPNVLSIDLDAFLRLTPEEREAKFNAVSVWAEGAQLITLATSPGYMEDERQAEVVRWAKDLAGRFEKFPAARPSARLDRPRAEGGVTTPALVTGLLVGVLAALPVATLGPLVAGLTGGLVTVVAAFVIENLLTLPGIRYAPARAALARLKTAVRVASPAADDAVVYRKLNEAFLAFKADLKTAADAMKDTAHYRSLMWTYSEGIDAVAAEVFERTAARWPVLRSAALMAYGSYGSRRPGLASDIDLNLVIPDGLPVSKDEIRAAVAALGEALSEALRSPQDEKPLKSVET
ncbi:MAG: UPF0489 family protein, partial [Elusimicrobia bacterium]|nr:UPF0489 family protein [Elusimicrobiota bacterium]